MKRIVYSIIICLLVVSITYAQVGVGTATPASGLQVAGAVAMNVRTVMASALADINDEVIVFTGASAATITLPDATNCTGRIYWIKNASTTLPAPACTIATSSSQTIDGQNSWLLDEPMEVVRLVSDGTGWQVFSQVVSVRKTVTVGTPWLQGGNKLKSMKSVGVIENYAYNFITDNIPRVHLSAIGLLGLGTTSPSGRLHSVTENDDAANDYIFQDHSSTVTQGLYIRKSRGTIVIPSDLQNGDLVGQYRFAPRNNGSVINTSGSGIDAYYTGTGTNASSDLRFFASGAEAMMLHQSGYAGIGTSTFGATNQEKLLVDAGNTSSYNVISGKGEIDNYLQLNIKNSSGGNTASSDIVATADNGTESINYIDLGINSSGYTSALIPILDGVNEAYLYATGGDMKVGNGATYDLGFFTNGYALANERMRITAAGNVGIGINTPADKLSIAGILSPAADNTYSIGSIVNRWSEVWATNGVIQTSDIRLKKNIQPLHYGLSTLMKLNPVSYHWKKQDNIRTRPGLIAQEVKLSVPEVVTGDETKEMLGMNYAELVPVLIKTIQEQQMKLAELKSSLKTINKEYRN